MRTRKRSIQKWEASLDKGYDTACKGSSALVAAAARSLFAEVAIRNGKKVCGSFFDMEKLCEKTFSKCKKLFQYGGVGQKAFSNTKVWRKSFLQSTLGDDARMSDDNGGAPTSVRWAKSCMGKVKNTRVFSLSLKCFFAE